MFTGPVTHDNLPKAVEVLLSKIEKLEAALESKNEPKGRRIPTREAKKILLEKGYKVSSPSAFINLVKNLEIPRVRAGANEMWYDLESILSLPSKTK